MTHSNCISYTVGICLHFDNGIVVIALHNRSHFEMQPKMWPNWNLITNFLLNIIEPYKVDMVCRRTKLYFIILLGLHSTAAKCLNLPASGNCIWKPVLVCVLILATKLLKLKTSWTQAALRYACRQTKK